MEQMGEDMYEIPAGTSVEIIRPNEDAFDWDDTVEHVTKHTWLCSKGDMVIDPLGNVAAPVDNLIGFVMHGEEHDTNFGRWEGAILITEHENVKYVG